LKWKIVWSGLDDLVRSAMKKLTIVLILTATLTSTWLLSRRYDVVKDLSEAELTEVRRKESFALVANSRDELTRQLFIEQIKHGTSIDSVVPLFSPVKIDSYGPYSVYQFDERGYSWRTLTTYDDKVVQASVGSCTWNWEFFDFIPADDAIKIGRIRVAREYVYDYPEEHARLAPLIQDLLSSFDHTRQIAEKIVPR
jgi:hypothetical protein